MTLAGLAMEHGAGWPELPAWFPRLIDGSRHERDNWRLLAGGEGIHWPELDEDISVEGLLEGRRSNENERSLER